jgi:hypothetical protein
MARAKGKNTKWMGIHHFGWRKILHHKAAETPCTSAKRDAP